MLVYVYIYIYIFFFFFTRRFEDIFFAKQEIAAEKKQPDALDSYLETIESCQYSGFIVYFTMFLY